MPALLAALGVPGEEDRIGLDLGGVRRICLLLVDGLGAEALAEHPGEAPFLAGLAGPTLTAGFPSTTAASLGSLGTGRPPGEHGIVGYLLAVPGHDRVMNTLQWRLHGPGPAVDLLSDVVPEQFQPAPAPPSSVRPPTGWRSSRLGPAFQERSGPDPRRAARRAVPRQPLGRRPGRRSGSHAARRRARARLRLPRRPRPDRTPARARQRTRGHSTSPTSTGSRRRSPNGSPPTGRWSSPPTTGWSRSPSASTSTTAPDLLDGVRLVGGEPRARHVYARAGAAADVLAAWQASLGGTVSTSCPGTRRSRPDGSARP